MSLKTISVAPGGGGGGSGTVTNVAQTFTGGIISVSGSPITTSGTLALTVAGTSGGVPYFSNATAWASSAALTANALMIGGGAGAAPSTTATGTGVLTALGNATNGSGGLLTQLTVGTVATSGGAAGQIMFDTGSVLSESSSFTFNSTNPALTLAGGTVTASNPVLNLTQTWNNASATFTGIKLNATNTASGASSSLMDLQVGGNSQFTIDKTGNIYWGLTNNSSFMSLQASSQSLNFYVRNSGTACSIGYSAGDNYITLGNVTLHTGTGVEGTYSLGMRTGVNAQTFRVYNTYTDASNYERGVFDWQTSSNVLTIGTENAGTGTARYVKILSATKVVRYDTSTVAGLPSAATAGAGARSFVTNATAPVFGSSVTGGGSVNVPVYSDGTNWVVG
jgi:hypothetical protein